MNAVTEVLRTARAKIENPKRWTQTAFARNQQGESTSPSDPQAVCWCAVGAIQAVAGNDTELGGAAVRAVVPYARAQGSALLSTYNDLHSHTEVLGLFDQALEQVERQATDG